MRSIWPLANPPSPWLRPPEEFRELKAVQVGLGVPPEWQIDPEQDHWPLNYFFGVKSCAPAEHLAVKAALGIPAERPTVEVSVVNPPGWHGYHFDLFGTSATAEDPPKYASAPRFWLYSGNDRRCQQAPPCVSECVIAAIFGDAKRCPFTTSSDPPKPPGDVLAILALAQRTKEVLLAWHRRVVYQHGLPWVEVQWHPERGLTEPVYYTEGCTRGDIEAIFRGQRLLRHLGSPGRPVGTHALTQDEFLQKFQQSKQRLQQQGEKITQEKVAAEMHLPSDTQLRRYLHAFGLSWTSLKNGQ